MDSVQYLFNVACDGCVSVVSLIFKTLSFSFNLSCFVGQLIVNFAVSIVTLLIDFLAALHTLLQVLTEDYVVFLSDFGNYISLFCKCIFQGAENFCEVLLKALSTVAHGVLLLKDFFHYFLSCFLSLISSLWNALLSCVILIKNSLLLVGSTVWELCVFLPVQITYLKRALISSIVSCMEYLRDGVLSFRRKLFQVSQDICLFISDIPKESLYGLFICIVLGFIYVKYHRSIRPVFFRYVVYILNQSQKTLMIAWTYLEAFTLWLLTNQMTPSSNGIHHFTVGADRLADDNNHEQDQNINEGIAAEEMRPENQERKFALEQEDRLCVVCQDNERCTIILPCRHVCLCHECCGTIKRTHGRCPVCRQVVRRTMRVFI